MFDAKKLDEQPVSPQFRVWSKRKNAWVIVGAGKGDGGVDELLRTGVGTRMLVPDWDVPIGDESS